MPGIERLDRDFTASVPFIVDVFDQRIVAWHAATSREVELVMTALRSAIWQRQGEGHFIERDELIGHADAGSLHASITFTEHLGLEGIRPRSGRSQLRAPIS